MTEKFKIGAIRAKDRTWDFSNAKQVCYPLSRHFLDSFFLLIPLKSSLTHFSLKLPETFALLAGVHEPQFGNRSK
jgi:hypothetical protein